MGDVDGHMVAVSTHAGLSEPLTSKASLMVWRLQVRHLADYVLIWTGGGGDDLAKSPHMARIGNSVFQDICPGDPTCAQFGFYGQGEPTPMMRKSLLYNLHSAGQKQGIEVDGNRFKEVFMSKYGKVTCSAAAGRRQGW